MDGITIKTPWAGHTGNIPLHLTYPDGTMVDAVRRVAKRYPSCTALDFMGKPTAYRTLMADIEACARGLAAVGVQAGDVVTIALPNCPQAVCLFYAVNLIGGVCSMIHPLSAEKEIEFYLNEANSRTIITLDQFYPKVAAIRENTQLQTVIIARIADALTPLTRLGYALTEGRKLPKLP